MSKKTMVIVIEVDMDSKSSAIWKNKDHFFESEVDDAFDEISNLGDPKRYTSRKGETICGTKWTVKISNSKTPNTL